MLVEKTPKLAELDTKCAGSASDYRGPDFRKPFKRHFIEEYGSSTEHGKIPDFPVFSGPYSTMVYLDEVTVAVEQMLSKLKQSPGDYYNFVSALFFHRPYNMMPIQAMSLFVLTWTGTCPLRETQEILCGSLRKGKGGSC
ncbi:hydroxymethylglutaryl-CoA synthase [Trypanosoma rangeli]|uniref:Hydroxymethylglutaryl-CoA synthase n=1 Tax=Trypanosoma rangeli TaxID=5698 RepID=A0A3S5IS48_TRYRA|nr:hydroxymethylglutaryl-CoA synthase [Trypanosoma rangeli]RNF09899.1 hydroxymethylglutaryl-CoA synthase [Trypanosoma rangeli]|eukprot:RNF09899.1 hydroxymethylglutaryl-CoA synthase [Trypanosoma rangeli]